MEMFADSGVHAVVDGQFGSTGKGLMASYLAEESIRKNKYFDICVSNAGPNSGHTFYHNGQKIVLKQLPSFAVQRYLLHNGSAPIVYLTAGAVIDPAILSAEANRYPGLTIFVHPNAAVIHPADKEAEHSGSIAAVAGTRSGTGQAIANKILRKEDATFGAYVFKYGFDAPNVVVFVGNLDPNNQRIFMEVSQGFSLGINSEFYPKVTSRECTVTQGLADARLPPRSIARTFMVVRTFPIRVGNVDGYSSGDFYEDQEEISFHALGVPEERTTVTNRVRRIFTWSDRQFREAMYANQPDFVLFNFMNYLAKGDELGNFYNKISKFMNEFTFTPLYGWGPENNDITPF